MIDTIRTLLWVNAKRLRAGKLPRLWMPVNQRLPRRSQSCPLARALPGNVAVWEGGYSDVEGDIYSFSVPHPIPPYAIRYVTRADRELQR